MPAHLKLIIENTPEQLQDYRLMKTLGRYQCVRKTCNHKWTATIEHMMENDFCPKCKR
jgi:hypothetical protein